MRQTLVKNSLIIVFECGFTRFVPFCLLSPVFAVACVAVACAAVAVVVNFLKKNLMGKLPFCTFFECLTYIPTFSTITKISYVLGFASLNSPFN